MQTSLLATKLYFPTTRPEVVPRPHLVERLQAGLRGSLTLISAPAGYGKKTLLSEWRTGPGAGMPAAWLSLRIKLETLQGTYGGILSFLLAHGSQGLEPSKVTVYASNQAIQATGCVAGLRLSFMH